MMKGQINFENYLQSLKSQLSICGNCICRNCLYWWSHRCPHGGCYDDLRAKENPYDKAHPNEPPRTMWSYWNRPGEQAHWCRGGIFYPVRYCENFVKYKGQQVKTCLKTNVSVFQDGYIDCSIIDTIGCERCYEEFERGQK